MKTAIGTTAVIALLLGAWGCGGGGDGIVTPAATRVYVDAANTGTQDGSAAHPYSTIEAAIAVASDGMVVTLAPGTYKPDGGTLMLKGGVSIEGTTAASTVIDGHLLDNSTTNLPVSVSKVTFDTYRLARPTPSADPTGVLEIKNCVGNGVEVVYGGRSAPTDKAYGFIVENNVLNGSVGFRHGQGAATNIIRNNRIVGAVELTMGPGASNTVADNTVTGKIAVRCGECSNSVSGNTVTGQIVEVSGGRDHEVVENNTVTYNGGESEDYNAAIVVKSRGATVRNNTVTCAVESNGIYAVSGTPTHITGNHVTVPYAATATDPEYPSCGICTKSGAGSIKGNTIAGGFYGIYDASAGTVENNTVTGAHHGLYAQGGGAYTGNTISGCQGDGIVAMGAPGPFTSNSVTDNVGAGVRVVRALFSGGTIVDFGGGALSGAGGNTFTGNARMDFVVEALAADAATIYARHNTWDHSSNPEIHASDIVDGRDVATLSLVEVVTP